jgi:DNA-binding CsgD family transcriptional regulator
MTATTPALRRRLHPKFLGVPAGPSKGTFSDVALSRKHAAARNRIQRLCYAGLSSHDLRLAIVEEFRSVTPIAGAFFPTVDPSTLLYTSAVVQGMPVGDTARYLDNELLTEDVNKFRDLARSPIPIATLDNVTRGDWAASPRSREIMQPAGHGDELRAAFRTGQSTWGVLCLHRSADAPVFGSEDVELVTTVAADIAEGLRRALLVSMATTQPASEGPGVLTIAADLTVTAATPAGARWLAELADADATVPLPIAVHHVVQALQLLGTESGLTPRLTAAAPSGRWLTLHASHLAGESASGDVAVVIEPATPPALEPVIAAAYALSDREAEVFARALRGLPTKAIARELRISVHTVNDHLKSIFTKTGVSTRGELMATVFHGRTRPI